MNNENNFSQNIEQPEQAPQTFTATFDQNHFDGQEIAPEVIDYQNMGKHSWLPGILNKWWEKICLENKSDIDNEKLEEAVYYLIEVARNAIEKVGSGEIKVTFDKNTITFVVTDQGQGFEDPITQIKRQHGLYEVKGYADQMIIESNGKKYIKEPNTPGLALSPEATDVTHGSRITFTKNYDQGSEEN